MRGVFSSLILLTGWLFSSALHAQPLDAQSYGYPLHNPFEATIATTPSALQLELPSDEAINQSDLRINLRPEREFLLPKNFWPVTTLPYRLARQKTQAPLVFIISGTGSSYSSSSSDYLKRLFYSAGMHVIQLSSPTSYDFMAAASKYATPGISPVDANDLYRTMQAIIGEHPDLPVSHFYLTGFSIGALHAAFVSQLDEQQQQFNFKRVLLLNPPVNLLTSVTTLDRLVQVQVKGVTDTTTFYDLILQKLSRYFIQRGNMDLNEAMLFDFQQSKERLSDEQLAMLIGASFRFAAADIAFTSDLINRRGLIIPPSYPMSSASSLTPFFTRALQCDFECYMHEQVVPLWKKLHPGSSFEELIHASSLTSLEDYLAHTDKILVMHNADDLILGKGDLSFLRRTLGERLIVYPHGGHGGNLNYKVNSQTMLEFFHE